MDQPRVTVITIFLDPGEFLAEAIDSVLGQTYPDLEYILVDDGSTDGSTEVARRAAAADPHRVRYLDHEAHANLGMSRSRNAGLEAAHGEFVAFLDADDVWVADAVERQVATLDAHPDAAMVIGATSYWSSWAPGGGPDRMQALAVEGVVQPPALASERLHQRSNAPSMNAALARRSAIEQVGGFEAGFTGMYEDQVFFTKFFLVHPVVVHHEVVDRYRQHPGSASARWFAEGGYDPDGPNAAGRTFRRFALDHVASGPWRGTAVHRDARWLHRWDRWPRMSRHLYRFRPGFARRNLRRLRRTLRRRLDPRLRPILSRHPRRGSGTPPPGQVRFGDLRRTSPIARDWGYGRGGPVDRVYIEGFLERHHADICGRVLEVGDDTYTRRFGRDRVTRSDVLHVDADAPGVTFVGDLADGDFLPDAAFDCIVLTQTLHLIFDFGAALRTLDRALRPGGVLLLTVPGVSPIDEGEWGASWYYAFTHHALARMAETYLDTDEVEVRSHGNALAAVAFLHGLGVDELTAEERDRHEVTHSIVHTLRVRKSTG